MRAVAVVTLLGCALGGAAGCGRLDYASVPRDAGAASDAAATPSDAGPDFDGGSSELAVSGLAPFWATPNGVLWTWERTGNGVGFGRYELVIGTSQAEVLDRGPSARVIGPARAPELGFWDLPDTDGDAVTRVLTDELVPDTTYFAQLTLFDDGGRELSRSGVALTTTPPTASQQIVIFSDADTPGYSIPEGLMRDTTNPYAGSACYRYVSSCASTPELCFDNLRRQEVSVDSSSLAAAGVLPNAFLEIAVSLSASRPSYWSEVWLRFGGSTSELARYNSLTLRNDGEYQLLEIPIAKFVMPSGDGPTSSEASSGIYEFSVGGLWADGAVVDIDEVRVRWPGGGDA